MSTEAPARPAPPDVRTGPSPWATLAVLAAAQFVVVLDVTIVNVALPSIQSDLRFSASGLQWVISSYTLAFGSLLLLGGRVADLVGRRRLFTIGLVLFLLTSLGAGLANSAGLLIAFRSVQGIGGALLSPAALSILTVTFAHGRQRNIAMGIWGGLAGLGGTLGVVAGGVLVDGLSWRWVFFVNVPIALALVAITPYFVRESKAAADGKASFDVLGTIFGTAGVLALVLGVIRSEPSGWGSAEVIGLLVGAVVLLTVFVQVERRSEAPLVPMHLFRSRGLSVSTAALAINGATFLAMFFLTAVFLQEAVGRTALGAGLAFLPMGFAAIAGAVVASNLVTRIGTRTTQIGAAALGVVGLALMTRASADSSYATHLLPGLVVFGLSIVALGTAAQIAATADSSHENAGVVSGVVTAGYQIGGAAGLAVISTLATSHVTSVLASGATQVAALEAGFHRGLWIAAAFGAVNVALGFLAPQLKPTAEEVAEAAAAA